MDIRTKNNIESVLKDSFSKKGWGLCIGAGTSLPIFPRWDVLVEKLIAKDTKFTNPKLISNLLLEEFSADTPIQAVQNKLEFSDENFANLLKEELYENLKNISGNRWDSIKTIFESDDPHKQKDPIWEDLYE